MISVLTDKRFLIGLAVGYLVVPRAAMFARTSMQRLKPATAQPTTA